MTNSQEIQAAPLVYLMVNDPIMAPHYKEQLLSAEYKIVWHPENGNYREVLTKSFYDIIIVDFSVFDQNALSHLQDIQRISPKSTIVVISDADDAQTVVNTFKAGIADYYVKPVSPGTLGWAIQKLLQTRKLSTGDEALNSDLELFQTVHHINMADNDSQMRDFAVKYLLNALEAAGAMWVWVDANKIPGRSYTRRNPYCLEPIYCEFEFAEEQLQRFIFLHPNYLETSFQQAHTSNPSRWFLKDMAWIPLSQTTLGGALFFGVTQTLPTHAIARVDFLVKNLDLCLENFKRFQEAKEQTYIDDLTGLYNSRFLEIALAAAIEKANTGKRAKGFSVLFVDIDHFKQINDKHGHINGSQMLVQIAKALKGALRRSDLIFRYGGDEFVAILNDITLEDAGAIAERLRKTIEKRRFKLSSLEIAATLSIGIARFPDQGRDVKTVLQMADRAMYESKRQGRNKVFLAKELPKMKKTGTSS